VGAPALRPPVMYEPQTLIKGPPASARPATGRRKENAAAFSRAGARGDPTSIKKRVSTTGRRRFPGSAARALAPRSGSPAAAFARWRQCSFCLNAIRARPGRPSHRRDRPERQHRYPLLAASRPLPRQERRASRAASDARVPCRTPRSGLAHTVRCCRCSGAVPGCARRLPCGCMVDDALASEAAKRSSRL
jgi:hypothetical protein